MKNQTKLPFLRTENLVVKELPNELLIYDLKTNKAFCLNETARLIMDECNGISSIDEATNSLNRKLKSNISEEMVWMVIEQLQKFDLIESNYEVPVLITRVSRRKILHSAAALGLTLPIITSIVAPMSAQAQSGCVAREEECLVSGAPGGSNCCPGLTCTTIDFDTLESVCLGTCLSSGASCLNSPLNCCAGFECNTVSFTCTRSCIPLLSPCGPDDTCCFGGCSENICQ